MKSTLLAASNEAPVTKGSVRLIVSNMYPATVGAMVRTLIRAKLLIPMAVAVSRGSTILEAKVCLMGMENISTTLIVIIRAMANGNHVVKENITDKPATMRREAAIVETAPNLFTILGTRM